MSQFTSLGTADPSGAKVNAVLDTSTNTITYTVTTTAGFTATTSAPAGTAGDSVSILNSIRQQITAQSGSGIATATALAGFGDVLSTVQSDTTTQSEAAPGGVQETKPIPTNSATDPAVAPAPNNTPLVENSSPPAAIPTASDPAQQLQANQDIVEIIKYDGGVTTVSSVQDPAQRAQIQQDAIATEAPAVISTFEDPAQRGAALQEAIENPGPVYPSNIVDPAQRQQNEIIQSEFPAIISSVQDPAQRAQALQTEIEFADSGPQTAANPMGLDPAQSAQGLSAVKTNTQSQATQQDASNFAAKADWRVRLSLAPGASYLYKANPAGILAPLQATDGIIFPYTPDISVNYVANYDPTELTHSNYKFFTYRGSAVDTITLGCEFTAQDTAEANYVLAVIHFFRSITKMFYGQDQTPSNGTPPPLCYLTGLGAFQFDAHPLAITNFTYKLPTDVDYIQAGSTSTPVGVNQQNSFITPKLGEDPAQAAASRLGALLPGALAAAPNWQTSSSGTKEPTYVPTKIMLSITAVPIVTRNDISNNFSLQKYATGELLRGTKRSGGGIW